MILLEQSFAAHMPLLMTASTFRLGRRCYSHPHCTNKFCWYWKFCL